MLIPFFPEPKVMIKKCIDRAKKRASQTTGYDLQSKKKKRELIRVESLSKCLSDRLKQIIEKTANFDRIPKFYVDLISIDVSIRSVKRALAVVDWLAKKVSELDKDYRRKMRKSKDIGEITRMRKQFEARIESLLEKNRPAFNTLINAGQVVARLPKIKEMPTVILAGFPNVGKSSILRGLSGADVKIREYPFTTKKILVGYVRSKYREVQVVDVPGLLGREKMNRIEKQAFIALKHLSNHVLFIVDPSETCGYDIGKQLSLMNKLMREGLELKVVSNKRDLKAPEFHADIVVSANDRGDMERLKEFIFDWLFS